MLRRLKAALEARRASEPAVPSGSTDPVRLACAALLTRAAWLDGHLSESEEAAVERAMVERFVLKPDDVRTILAEAEEDLARSVDIYRYTRALRVAFDEKERIELLEMLWEVVHADGVVHAYEAQLMRRLAGLLYVEDRDSGAARKRALARLGLAGNPASE